MTTDFVEGNILGMTVDGRHYEVAIVYESIQRSFKIEEGNNSGIALTGKKIRDLIGTRYSYEVEIIPIDGYENNFYELYELLSAPYDYHTIRFPYGDTYQNFKVTTSVTDCIYSGMNGSSHIWKSFKLSAECIECGVLSTE